MLLQADRDSEEPAGGGSQPPSRPRKPPPAGVRIPKNIDVLLCELCNGGHHEDQILLCDGCDRGFHMFCLSPPLEKVPAGEWLCPFCLQAKTDNTALRVGTEMSWTEFEKNANAAKRIYWGGDARARKVGLAGLKFVLPYHSAARAFELLFCDGMRAFLPFIRAYLPLSP